MFLTNSSASDIISAVQIYDLQYMKLELEDRTMKMIWVAMNLENGEQYFIALFKLSMV